MYQLYKDLTEEKICLSYLGSFNDEITDKLIGLSENHLENVNQISKLKNKVSFLIAECFQNVVRHGGAKEAKKVTVLNHKDFFQISVFNDRVVLSSSNLIDNAHVEDLKYKINQVNSLSGDELKNLYAEVLENQGFSSKGGAGLGLIEMARKSGLPLKNSFNLLTNVHSAFFLGLEIVNMKEISTAKIDISFIKDFYKKLIEKDILILYKGDFSKESISSLIGMLQNNFTEVDNIPSRKIKGIITLIEVLQNVSKHGMVINGIKEGIFAISNLGEGLIIECGNFVEEEKVESFKSNLAKIKTTSLDGIIKLYKRKLVDAEITSEGNCGLGLYEIARNSSNQFTYNFVETSKKYIFFSIKIKV